MKPTPIKPTATFRRVARGGTWVSTSATFVSAASRLVVTPSSRYSNVGFRCAQRGCRQVLKVTP